MNIFRQFHVFRGVTQHSLMSCIFHNSDLSRVYSDQPGENARSICNWAEEMYQPSCHKSLKTMKSHTSWNTSQHPSRLISWLDLASDQLQFRLPTGHHYRELFSVIGFTWRFSFKNVYYLRYRHCFFFPFKYSTLISKGYIALAIAK